MLRPRAEPNHDHLKTFSPGIPKRATPERADLSGERINLDEPSVDGFLQAGKLTIKNLLERSCKQVLGFDTRNVEKDDPVIEVYHRRFEKTQRHKPTSFREGITRLSGQSLSPISLIVIARDVPSSTLNFYYVSLQLHFRY
ncbi:hypothetical protein HAX54_043138 [Datura stramonium]|uniref:Uncharacterized protein n=1 Tax=Datura stramonium TaxID=4076 RepID=A0ABS8SMQ3_DATST|nr:hypothetical protein [Datura stramonium]